MLFNGKLEGTDSISAQISFFRTKPMICPVCESSIVIEDFKTGSGRLNAGTLQPDLYRPYLPNEEFGDVFPLLYAIGTCPKCYFSALWSSF